MNDPLRVLCFQQTETLPNCVLQIHFEGPLKVQHIPSYFKRMGVNNAILVGFNDG
jgi:hypothetical protein